MSPALFRSTLIVIAVCTGGCVYYNGMYNANRLARSARKAEREGRTFEANGLWGQVATKAESVMVRHPTSKYAPEAEVLRGVALARLGQCEEALGPLARVPLTPLPADLAEDALLASGRCQVAAGNLEAGDAAFSQLLKSRDPARRREARYQHARVLRQRGAYREALVALAEVKDPRVTPERLLALAGAGDLARATALADSMIARGDTGTRRWDSLLVALGTESPVAASSVLDRVRKLPGRGTEAQAQLLLEDGLRLSLVDSAQAKRRFREALALGANGKGNAAGRAGLELVRLELRAVRRPEDLPSAVRSLQQLARRFPRLADEISLLGSRISTIHAVALSNVADTGRADMRVFLGAELARDSLAAPILAEAMFRQVPERFPTSPYAPKAILAAQQLNPTWADSARALLEERYFDSPYLSMVRGEPTQAYVDLEDSLGTFAAALRPPARRRTVNENEGDRPVQRRPAPGDARVPEPQ